MTAMIKLRHQQPSLWHRGLAEDIEGLWEPWMRLVDELLEDEQLVDTVYEAQGERHPQSRMRGRMQTPAEVVLRLLLLKHIRNWSYDVLEREVRANLVYRAFTRIGDEKVPDAKTLARLGQLIEPRVVEQLHQRVVELAQERGVTEGKKLRVDTTVVESNIHYPTDSSLLGEVKQAPRCRRTPVAGLAQWLETMVGRVRQVVKQTKIRIFAGETKSPGKIVSVFEAHTEIIRKGKASKPNEFGKLVKIQEAENQIVTHFEVFAERPADSTLLLPSIEVHQQRLGRIPRAVAADAGFYSRENEKAGQALGVRWMSVPNKKTTSSERKLLQHQRWFRNGQKWRTGSEGRISVLKRRHGLRRCLYPGLDGMRRWVGLGVIADNFIQMGCYLAREST